jgi:PKD repeat protein
MPTSSYFAGDLDEFAVYPVALTPEQIAAHYAAAHDAIAAPPTAVFTPTVTGLKASMDASASVAAGTKTIASYAWDFGDGATATGVTAAHTYAAVGTYMVTLTVVDSIGLVTKASKQVSTRTPYSEAVVADGASLYWSLGEGATATQDRVGTNDAVVGSGASSAPGTVPGDVLGATRGDGTDKGVVSASAAVDGPGVFSTEVWFNTTTSQGGKLTGYGRSQSGSSSSYDRHVYMRNDGTLSFGVYTGAAKTITSPGAYNDGRWHQVVASLDASGMKLSVDGELVAEDGAVTASIENYSGYWRLGGDNLASWPGMPTSSYFAGDLDEFAVYPVALTPEQIAAHYAAGTARPAEPVSGTVLAKDTFERTGTSWGATDSAHAWSSDKGMSTADGRGVIALPGRAQQRSAWLNTPVIQDTELTMDVSFDKVSAGGGSFLSAALRHTDAGDYRLKLVVNVDRSVSVNLVKLVGATETTLTSQVLRNYRYTPGEVLTLRLRATTAGDVTTLQTRVWKAVDSEPATWLLTATDSTAALRGPGKVGLVGYLSSGSTIAPQTIRVDNLTVAVP